MDWTTYFSLNKHLPNIHVISRCHFCWYLYKSTTYTYNIPNTKHFTSFFGGNFKCVRSRIKIYTIQWLKAITLCVKREFDLKQLEMLIMKTQSDFSYKTPLLQCMDVKYYCYVTLQKIRLDFVCNLIKVYCLLCRVYFHWISNCKATFPVLVICNVVGL